MATTRHRSLVERDGRKALLEALHTQTKKIQKKIVKKNPIFSNLKKWFEQIELPAKLLDYFLRSHKSNINQSTPQKRCLCCRVLQCVPTWCSAAQCDAVWCSALQRMAVWYSVLQCASKCQAALSSYSVYHSVAVRCSLLQCVVPWWCVLQSVAIFDFGPFANRSTGYGHTATHGTTLYRWCVAVWFAGLLANWTTVLKIRRGVGDETWRTLPQ